MGDHVRGGVRAEASRSTNGGESYKKLLRPSHFEGRLHPSGRFPREGKNFRGSPWRTRVSPQGWKNAAFLAEGSVARRSHGAPRGGLSRGAMCVVVGGAKSFQWVQWVAVDREDDPKDRWWGTDGLVRRRSQGQTGNRRFGPETIPRTDGDEQTGVWSSSGVLVVRTPVLIDKVTCGAIFPSRRS